MMGKLYSQKRNLEKEELTWCQQVSIWVSFITAFIFLVMAYSMPKYGVAYAWFTFMFGVISISIFSIIGFINFFQVDYEIKPYADMVQGIVKEYLDVLNRTSFRRRGMEW